MEILHVRRNDLVLWRFNADSGSTGPFDARDARSCSSQGWVFHLTATGTTATSLRSSSSF
jgi:hypothetical protein